MISQRMNFTSRDLLKKYLEGPASPLSLEFVGEGSLLETLPRMGWGNFFLGPL